jgi:Cu(I)/Ag(I) efflux system membrane protein CusA/SilA
MCRQLSRRELAGRNVAENIEGRERYPINVRYEQDFRDSVDRMRSVLIGTPSGSQIPLGQVARISFSNGPAMIRDEDGQLTGYIYINLKDANYGAFVDAANRLLARSEFTHCRPNYSFTWSGEYQFELRAKERMKLIVPVVFALIFPPALYGLSFRRRGPSC